MADGTQSFELAADAALRQVRGTTEADIQGSLDSLKLVAKELVALATVTRRQMRAQDLTQGYAPGSAFAAQMLAETFSEAAGLKPEMAELLSAYVSEEVA
jgi:hypothetical protein